MITLFLDNQKFRVFVSIHIDDGKKAHVEVLCAKGGHVNVTISNDRMKIGVGELLTEDIRTALWCIYNEAVRRAKHLLVQYALEGKDMRALDRQFQRWVNPAFGGDTNYPDRPIEEECKRIVKGMFSEIQ